MFLPYLIKKISIIFCDQSYKNNKPSYNDGYESKYKYIYDIILTLTICSMLLKDGSIAKIVLHNNRKLFYSYPRYLFTIYFMAHFEIFITLLEKWNNIYF